jgi:hypothetical protein
VKERRPARRTQSRGRREPTASALQSLAVALAVVGFGLGWAATLSWGRPRVPVVTLSDQRELALEVPMAEDLRGTAVAGEIDAGQPQPRPRPLRPGG